MRCQWCKTEMSAGGGCTVETYDIGGQNFARIPYNADGGRSCHDCGVADGKFHHPGCDGETCPKCGDQAIGCSCNDEEVEEDE